MVFDVTNLGVVLVPYQPNSEEIRNTDAASKQASKQASKHQLRTIIYTTIMSYCP